MTLCAKGRRVGVISRYFSTFLTTDITGVSKIVLYTARSGRYKRITKRSVNSIEIISLYVRLCRGYRFLTVQKRRIKGYNVKFN